MRPNRGAVVVLVLSSSVLWSVGAAVSRDVPPNAPWTLDAIPRRIEADPAMTGVIEDRNGAILARPEIGTVGRRSMWVISRPYGSALADIGLGRTALLEHGVQGNLSGLMRTGAESLRKYEAPGRWTRFLVGDPVLTSPPMPTVRLTVDAELTRLTYRILGRFGGKASAVVLNARTGELIVLADYPGPDVTADKQPTARNSLDALHGTNLPASTMKVLTAAYILEKRPAEAGRSHDCTGYRCWTRHGRVPNLQQAISQSCNTWFRLTVGTWPRAEWVQFVIDTGLQPVDAPGLPLTPIVFAGHQGNRMHWPQAIGQQVWVSMIGLASAYATLTSADGRRVNAFVVKGNGFARGKPQAVRSDVTRHVREMLRVTATTGTARLLNQVYRRHDAGGKTGTGQREGRTSDAVFAAVAPWNDPQWVVVVSLKGGGRGSAAGRVAADILNAVIGVP